MKINIRLLAIVTLSFFLLSCNLSSALTPAVSVPTSAPVEGTPVATPEMNIGGEEEDEIDLSPTPTTEGMLPIDDLFDICSVVTASEVEEIFGEPVGESQYTEGSCMFKGSQDGLNTLTISAAQGKEAVSILEEQISFMSTTGIQMDETFLSEVRSLTDQLDYRGLFTKLATSAKGSTSITAKLFSGGGNDIVYWAWTTVPPLPQGSFIAVRDTTVVNIYLETSDSMDESALLKQCNRFAGLVFERLPEEFAIFSTMDEDEMNKPTPTSEPSTESQSTAAQAETIVVPGLPAPVPVSPNEGETFSGYPRATTLMWEPVEGAAKYLVEIMACAPNDTDTCFSHPMLEKTTRETIETIYSFNFVGEQSGKWRVIPIDASGELGNPSEWRTFQYTE